MVGLGSKYFYTMCFLEDYKYKVYEKILVLKIFPNNVFHGS
jgi:hypothetical protein